MLYFGGNVMRPDCMGLWSLFPSCLSIAWWNPGAGLASPRLALRRWVVLLRLKAIHRVFSYFYETGAIL